MKSKEVALVLSSGGARGLAHIGAIDALLEHGYHIKAISGTSMGALVGGMYASGKLPLFRAFMTGLTRLDVIRLMDLAVSKRGIIKGERVFAEMKRIIGDVLIEDLPIPFAAISADLNNHTEIVSTSGDLLSAIRASSSIPSILLPIINNGSLLVDGGVINPLPMDRVKYEAGDLLVAVNVNAPYEENLAKVKSTNDKLFFQTRELINRKWNSMTGGHPRRTKINGVFDIVNSSFELMQHKMTLTALSQHKPDILVNLPVNLADTFGFHKANELIKAGYEAMNAQLLQQKEKDLVEEHEKNH
jgi:NTE family protein